MANFEGHPLHPGEAVPLFISPGVLREPTQLEPFMAAEDYRAVPLLFLGGYTKPVWLGNKEPNFAYDASRQAAGNAAGFPNGGEQAIRALKEPIRELNKRGIKTVIQVTFLPHEDPLEVVPELAEIAAECEPTAVEVNPSCPNTRMEDGSFHPPMYRDPIFVGELLAITRKRLGDSVTLSLKDGPHVDSPFEDINPESIRELAAHTRDYIDAVVGINTIANQEFPELTATGGRGGMSGPIVAPVAKQHLKLWREFAPDIPYLSTGGIDAQNAAQEGPERLAEGALRVGGAQDFNRAMQKHLLAIDWSIAMS
jgi:dihydroorotate dehydrogenase